MVMHMYAHICVENNKFIVGILSEIILTDNEIKGKNDSKTQVKSKRRFRTNRQQKGA